MEDNFDANIKYDNKNNNITVYGKVYENGSMLNTMLLTHQIICKLYWIWITFSKFSNGISKFY